MDLSGGRREAGAYLSQERPGHGLPDKGAAMRSVMRDGFSCRSAAFSFVSAVDRKTLQVIASCRGRRPRGTPSLTLA